MNKYIKIKWFNISVILSCGMHFDIIIVCDLRMYMWILLHVLQVDLCFTINRHQKLVLESGSSGAGIRSVIHLYIVYVFKYDQ